MGWDFTENRRFTFRCKHEHCNRQARASELLKGVMQWIPLCPKGHGPMTRVHAVPKKPLRGRKPRWSWMNGVRWVPRKVTP